MSLKVGVPWSSVFSKPILHFLIVNIVNGQHAFFTTGYWTEFRLNPISWLKYVAVSKGFGDWQLHFLPVKSLNEGRTRPWLNAGGIDEGVPWRRKPPAP